MENKKAEKKETKPRNGLTPTNLRRSFVSIATHILDWMSLCL
jgi:hypothetical protein